MHSQGDIWWTSAFLGSAWVRPSPQFCAREQTEALSKLAQPTQAGVGGQVGLLDYRGQQLLEWGEDL